MLHNIDDNDAPNATLTLTSTTTTTTTAAERETTIMAPNETTDNGTEPTISTHLANAATTTTTTTTTTIEPTLAAAAEQERNTATSGILATAPAPAAGAAILSTMLAVDGQAIATMAGVANTTLNAATLPTLLTATSTSTSASTTPLPLSAVAEHPELARTADGAATAISSTAAAAAAATASHTEAEETAAFDVQMRTQQQQKIKIYHGAKQSAVWRTDSLASNPSPSRIECGSTEMFGSIGSSSRGSGGSGYPTAPSLLQRKFSDSSFSSPAMPRRVSFPESDKELVTGYLEPANPWEQVCQVSSIAEISELYVQSCSKHHTQPLDPILDHLKALDLHLTRQPLLCLKGSQLTPNDCEPLEEIFKRIQYKAIDLSECPLNESCLSALCQMIEYYEAANELDISYNREPMTVRGWGLCTYMVGRSQELQLLNAEGNQISKVGADNLGNALITSNLHTLKLEHCGMKGPPLTSFCFQLYHNKVLRELWLGYNDLDCTDAQHIADMLRFNHTIELIDISNNNIRDEGVMYLVQALIMQATDLERRSGLNLQRARAIEDDEPVSPVEPIVSPTLSAPSVIESSNSQAQAGESKAKGADVAEKDTAVEQQSTVAMSSTEEADNVGEPLVAVLVDVENDLDDDNTEDTVRTLRSGNQSATGQSMLDKLLSMNSDSSSEEAPSNISTDTLAACCSEDISEMSNDVFESNNKLTTTAATEIAATDTATIGESPLEKATTMDISTGDMEQLITPEQQEQPQQKQQQQLSSQNERNLCDITPSTEAKTVEPNETCLQNNNNANNHTNSNNSTQTNPNNNNIHNNHNNNHAATNVGISGINPSGSASGIYEVTAEESDCINSGASGSRPLDMNKNGKGADDFEDTHSTDSAFESASEGDISRHLPDEFSRLSVSLESTRLDDMAKEMAIETATIASESTECLLVAEEAATPSSTPTGRAVTERCVPADATETPATTKVTIAAECLTGAKDKELSASPCPSPTPTPPPPSTSPGGVSSGLRRTESSCAYLNQSTRNRSQSSDSLCSENSLDGSTSAADPQLAEKLTKNDTLSRRHLADATTESANRAPSGLKALALWSNNLTKNCGPSIAELLSGSSSLELLNIGKNCLSNDFVATIKDSLTKNTTLTTLGLQSAHLSAKGIETLASILTFGGNSKLQRIDIRDNKLEVESLNIIADVLKSNKTITQIDINDEPKRLTLPIVPIVNVTPPTPLPQESIGSDAHMDYTRVLGTVRSMCSRNEKMQAEELELAEKAANVGGGSSSSSGANGNSSNSSSSSSSSNNINNRCRSGYYMGSRKISLTCHSRPLVDVASGTVTATLAVTALPTPAAKLEVKRKTNARLRSPGPSPPTISPSSSPNRSRFHVSRVNEIGSPLTSPLAQIPPQHPPQPSAPRTASSCMSIPSGGSGGGGGGGGSGLLGSQSSLNSLSGATSLPLPTSSSLPSMASVTSSTQTIKRLSVSPRSRFHVSRIYEDPHTPPINLPPTPMLKSARKAVAQSLAEAVAATSSFPAAASSIESIPATATSMPIVSSSVIIVEPSTEQPTAIGDDNDNAHEKSTNAEEEEATVTTNPKLSPQFTNSPSTSSSSCSSSPISSSATNSSSSSSSNTSSDVTDSSCSSELIQPAAGKICPIAVFGDNDITLTKDSVASVALSTAASNNSQQSEQSTAAQQQQPPAARARKSSWIANPTTVDKLLTLFNPSTMFQRSSSPESKEKSTVPVPAVGTAGAAFTTHNAQNIGTSGGSGDVNVTLMPTRKTTPPSRSNSYTIGTGGAGIGAVGGSLTSGTDSGAGSTSFLDTASRQLRDFGKQVFRQNLSFNSGGDGGQLDVNAGANPNPGMMTAMSPVAESPTNTVHMPLSLKRELKENISPEHTINEETLHTLQKLSRAEAASDLGDIEIVMHSEVSDCLPEVEQQQQQTRGSRAGMEQRELSE